jgi:hypothetical protein
MSRRQGSTRRIVARLLGILGTVGFYAAAHSSSAGAAEVARWFWVMRGSNIVHIQCMELARGRTSELYAARDAHLSRPEAAALLSTFEARILPTDVRLFGVPRRLGKVTLLLVPLGTSTLGYFDENDLSKVDSRGADLAHSNQGNVLYVNPQSYLKGASRLTALNEVIAHELQHLIEYRIRVIDHGYAPQELWLNEGLSFYAQIANGYWTSSDVLKVRAAAQMPSWPVVSLGESTEFLRRHARVAYGRAGLFASYLASRFGDSFIKSIVASRMTGLQAVDAALRAAASQQTLARVFADWGVAAFLHRHGVYGYGPLPVSLEPSPALLVPAVDAYPFDTQKFGGGLHLTPWGTGYIRLTINRAADLKLSVSGPAARISVAAVLQDPTGAVGTSVRWMTFQPNGQGVLLIRGFGGFYNRLTVVLSDTGTLAPTTSSVSDPVRVQASLVHVRDYD